MSTIESPLNKAHRHAANGDLWLSQGMWVKAADEHAKAADAFLTCAKASLDDNTKRTLFLLHEKHAKISKDLQRRDGSLPQRPPPLQRGLPPTPVNIHANAAAYPPKDQGPIEDSYLMLGQKAELSSSFAQFWKLLEGMLDQLSQPVAFATAPLSVNTSNRGPIASPLPGSSDSETGEPSTSRPRKLQAGKSIITEDRVEDTLDFDDGDWDAASDESFCVISDEENSRAAKSGKSDPLPALQEENAVLKAKLASALNRVVEVEQLFKERLKHEQQLRDGIRQAQRAISSSQIFQGAQGSASPPAGTSQPSPNADLATGYGGTNESHLISQVRELEEKLRAMHIQDVTQKATIVKYKERWDKVKESMRKKKVAKAVAEAQTSVRQNRIEEEAEPEF